jgi:hypothetical protein
LARPGGAIAPEGAYVEFVAAYRGYGSVVEPTTSGGIFANQRTSFDGRKAVHAGLSDCDPMTTFIQPPQFIDCSAQIPASANVLVVQGISNADTITAGYTDAAGNAHGLIACPKWYRSFTLQGLAGCSCGRWLV